MLPRIKVFSLHLIISALIILPIAGVVFYIWYPAPLHAAAGVTKIFLLILVANLMLGPLLTLLSYKPGKTTLITDLCIIVLLQMSSLMYGLYTVADGRPAWLVLVKDRFEMVRIPDIDERKLSEASTEYQKPSWSGPRWAAAKIPFLSEDSNQILFEAVAGGPDIAQRPNLYQLLSNQNEIIRQKAQPLSKLSAYNSMQQVDQLLVRHPTANGWLPLSANAQDMVVLVNKDTAEVINIVNLRPWH